MKVSKETTDKCEVILTVEIDDAQKQKLMQKAARRIAKSVRIPGFRPGKAPYNIIVNRFGEDAIREEATEDLTTNIYQKAVEEAEVTPFAPASLEDVQWEPLVMKIRIPTEPEVEIGDYRSIRREPEAVTITDEDVEHQLEHLRERFTTFNPVERAAQLGDMVSVSISEKFEDEEEPTDPVDDDMELLEAEGDDDTPDFTSVIVGKSVGETVTLTHTFPEDYSNDEFAGRTVEYTITINEIKEKEEVPLDDDFATLLGDYESLDDLKANIRKDLQERQESERDALLVDEVIEEIVQASEVKWPQVMEEHELDHAMEAQRARLKRFGIDLPIYLTAQNKTEEELREEMRESVRLDLKKSLVMGKIIENEELRVEMDEIIQEANYLVSTSRDSEEMLRAVQTEAGMRTIASSLLTNKATRRLLAIIKGEADAEEEAAEANGDADSETDAEAEPVAEAEE